MTDRRPFRIDEVADASGEAVALYCKGHVDKGEFYRSVTWRYDPDAEESQVSHEYWKCVPAPTGDMRDSLFAETSAGDPAGFPVTTIELSPWEKAPAESHNPGAEIP